MNELSSTLTILSAMVTPVALILASGQLILTTSQRLSRVIERCRKLSKELEDISTQPNTDTERQHLLFDQLGRAVRRSRLLQSALATLYISLSLFVATSISLALVAVTGFAYAWVPIALGLVGAGLLFFSSIALILESRAALNAVRLEMRFALQIGERLASDGITNRGQPKNEI
ncbi:DUF2721 domain-containing protein [Pontibacter korlensis]|uniref:DUF2721 domain-containing protein n=1 Tax=Pontibacter korlensis TaxID=400092 RepID=UPI0006978FA5|nr:DUF2721 domain-containing protein [Pontibacter korlensis]